MEENWRLFLWPLIVSTLNVKFLCVIWGLIQINFADTTILSIWNCNCQLNFLKATTRSMCPRICSTESVNLEWLVDIENNTICIKLHSPWSHFRHTTQRLHTLSVVLWMGHGSCTPTTEAETDVYFCPLGMQISRAINSQSYSNSKAPNWCEYILFLLCWCSCVVLPGNVQWLVFFQPGWWLFPHCGYWSNKWIIWSQIDQWTTFGSKAWLTHNHRTIFLGIKWYILGGPFQWLFRVTGTFDHLQPKFTTERLRSPIWTWGQHIKQLVSDASLVYAQVLFCFNKACFVRKGSRMSLHSKPQYQHFFLPMTNFCDTRKKRKSSFGLLTDFIWCELFFQNFTTFWRQKIWGNFIKSEGGSWEHESGEPIAVVSVQIQRVGLGPVCVLHSHLISCRENLHTERIWLTLAPHLGRNELQW